MSKSKANFSRTKARSYRALAVECERQAELAVEEPHFRDMQKRLANSYHALAEAEDWLEGTKSPMGGDTSGAMEAA